jgi:cytochrome c biogenesis protein CcmG/thiol:disulfide interchange protein DsbE
VNAKKHRPARPAGRNRRPAASSGSTWPWWVVGAAVVIAGVVAVAVSAGGGGGSSSSGGGTTSGQVEIASSVAVSGAPLPTLTDASHDSAVGKTAPTLTGVTFDRSPVTVTNTGRAHVVVFVAHWCPHCQAEVPLIVSLAQAGQVPVPLTGVATGTDPSAGNYPPSAWLTRVGWPYPVLVDSNSQTAAMAYGLASYPFMVFVDAQGKVAGRVTGEVASSDLTKLFAALAAGKPLPISGTSGASSSGP